MSGDLWDLIKVGSTDEEPIVISSREAQAGRYDSRPRTVLERSDVIDQQIIVREAALRATNLSDYFWYQKAHNLLRHERTVGGMLQIGVSPRQMVEYIFQNSQTKTIVDQELAMIESMGVRLRDYTNRYYPRETKSRHTILIATNSRLGGNNGPYRPMMSIARTVPRNFPHSPSELIYAIPQTTCFQLTLSDAMKNIGKNQEAYMTVPPKTCVHFREVMLERGFGEYESTQFDGSRVKDSEADVFTAAMLLGVADTGRVARRGLGSTDTGEYELYYVGRFFSS